MQKEICIVAFGYPTKDHPILAFLQPLAHGMADAGYRCSVIAPQSVTNRFFRKSKKRPYRWIDRTAKGNAVTIFQPDYITLSRIRLFGFSISAVSFNHAVMKCFRAEKMNPAVLYAHFWDSGIAACRIAQRHKIPVFVATGESKIWVRDFFPQKVVERNLPLVKGVIAVSQKNLDESENLKLLDHAPRTVVLPNAVDPRQFHKSSRSEARKALNWPKNDTIAIFVGSFVERKGPRRVLEAASRIPGLKLAFVGMGDDMPQSEQIVFCGTVPHEELVTYLNAADFFILPTLAEGCCNAIIEALACGLPVISSDRPFNDGILTDKNSIRIDPTSIDEIAGAMEKVYRDDVLRARLSEGALETTGRLKIDERVSRIIDFIENGIP